MIEMLAERFDGVESLSVHCTQPIAMQFRAVDGRPLDDKTEDSGWQ